MSNQSTNQNHLNILEEFRQSDFGKELKFIDEESPKEWLKKGLAEHENKKEEEKSKNQSSKSFAESIRERGRRGRNWREVDKLTIQEETNKEKEIVTNIKDHLAENQQTDKNKEERNELIARIEELQREQLDSFSYSSSICKKD